MARIDGCGSIEVMDLIEAMQAAVKKMSDPVFPKMPCLFVTKQLFQSMNEHDLIDYDNDYEHGLLRIPWTPVMQIRLQNDLPPISK